MQLLQVIINHHVELDTTFISRIAKFSTYGTCWKFFVVGFVDGYEIVY
jgi:hypothetical protein